MKKLKLIRGAGGGGKGGGGSARAAVEADNTLRSRQFARVIDLICEGEIEGLVGAEISPEHAERSIYFDGVPLRNEMGQSNFDVSAFSWAFVPGTQNQPVIPTGGSVASELQVSQEVKAGNTGGGPVVRSIPETYIDSCRVTVSVPRLTTQDTSNGDINGSSVQFAIDVQNNGGGFVQVMAPTISGKTNSEYQRSYEFDLPGTGPWDVRLRRITADATTSVVQNQLYWSTYTKIVKQQMNYPNTALVGLKVDAALFNRIPARAYRMKLLRVRIPVNYNPVTREYVGLWDGTFKVAWTDNPAWCWYDLATNERYGLGEYVDAGNIDKWTLYAIAQYCDKLVPDGYGNSEPRFRCNLYLNTREEALKVLMNFASIFRGIVYWHSNTIFCSQDRPGNPVKLFTPANVIDGVFNYTGSAKQARHTVAMVAWNDPENMYKQTVEYVEDREGILRLGVREAEVTAMGCTSRGQAHRLGKWILLTEREETDTITFKTGLEGCGVMPGEIIQTTDPSRAGERVGGRVLGSSASQLTLDAPVVLKPGKNYTVAVVLPSGVIEEKGVLWSGSTETSTSTLMLSTPLAQVPQKHAIWIMQTEDLVPELWRVLSTVEVGPNTVEIVALEHIPGKYAAIENNIKLESRPTSSIKVRPGTVTNLVAVTDVKKLNDLEYTTRIFVSWTPPKEGAARYVVTWRRVGNNSKTEIVNDPSIDIDDIPAGTFEISVLAENAVGLRGPVTTISHVVSASAVEPDVTGLRLNPNFLGPDCPITWDRLNWAVKYTVQVLSGTTVVREEITTTNAYIYSYTQNVADGGPRRDLTFKVKAHSWRGASANWAILEASNPAPATPVGLSVEAGPGQVSIFAERPTDFDLEGMVVWMHTSAAVPTTDGYIVYKGKDNAFMKMGLQAGIPAYFRVAFYDTFGTAGLNVSSSVAGVPTATGGIVMVDTLPGSPDDVAGQTAVFLDVADTALRGLYGWDGTSWKFTRDGQYLVANSVTADRLNVAQLSTISANLGTMTAGNITLNSQGFIKGGATSYSAGTGFWMGYDAGTYKLRAGTPGSSGFEWTGSAFNVYGPDGSITISSGVVDWGKIAGANKPENGATVGASYSQSFTHWDLASQSIVTVSDGKVGDKVLRLGVGGGYPTQTNFVPIDPTKKYRVRFWARPSSDCNGLLYFSLRQAVNETGTWGPFNGGRAPHKPAGQSRAAHNSSYGTDAWGEYSYIWSAADWQPDVKFFRPEFLENCAGTAGYWDVQGLVIEEVTDVESAKDAASAAQTAANTANTALADIAADNKLTPAEKKSVRKDWDAIYAERAGIRAQADSFGITTEKTNYDNDFQALGTYLNGGTAYTIGATPPNWITDANLAVTTTIVGTTFRANWSNLYADRQALLNKISAEAAKKADWASVTGSGKPENGATVGATFGDYNGAGRNISGTITPGNVTTCIANAAIGNAQIADASITNAKIANATILAANIADGNITNAKIANAAITNAKIGDAAVNTLQIAGNAVTVPIGVEASGAGGVVGTTAWANFQSAPVVITAAFTMSDMYGDTLPGPCYLRVRRNGGEVRKVQFIATPKNVSGTTASGTIVFLDYPGGGDVYYQIDVLRSDGVSYYAPVFAIRVGLVGIGVRR